MGRAWVFGDDLDTDQIVPGRDAPFMVGQDKFHTYAFCDARPGFAKEVRPGDILVGGENFGCGSSREYAVAALAKLGVGGIVAKSFARIFFRNCINLGIPVLESEDRVVEPIERVTLQRRQTITIRRTVPQSELGKFSGVFLTKLMRAITDQGG